VADVTPSLTNPLEWADLTVYPFGLQNRVVTGFPVLLEALARRLKTPRGGLFYDLSYGFDVRQFLNSRMLDDVLFRLVSGVETELEKDARVLRADVEVTRFESSSIELAVLLETEAGPWQGILRADSNDVQLQNAILLDVDGVDRRERSAP
jgi:hypothetical protein